MSTIFRTHGEQLEYYERQARVCFRAVIVLGACVVIQAGAIIYLVHLVITKGRL